YDTQGNVLSQTVTVDGTDLVTSYAYDSQGRLTKVTDAAHHDTTYTYDANGDRLTQTTTRTVPAGGSETLTTTYTSDKQARLLTTQDADGSLARTVYDELGHTKETYDKRNSKTSYTYDDMSRLTVTTYPDLTTDEAGYDNEGRRTSSKDRGGRTTSYEYD